MLNKLVGYQHASPGPFWAVEVRESVEKQNNNKKKFHASVDLVIGGGTNTFIAHSDIPNISLSEHLIKLEAVPNKKKHDA